MRTPRPLPALLGHAWAVTDIGPPAGAFRTAGALVLLGSTLLFAAFNLASAQGAGQPGAVLRFTLAVAALVFVFFARRQTLLRRAAFVLALEVVGGSTAFLLVDLPLIANNQMKIQHVSAVLYARARSAWQTPTASRPAP